MNWFINRPIAHRGLHNIDVPENTLKAFELAIEAGYSIELDIQQTVDGKIIAFHDDNLNRLTGLNKYVWKTSYEEIKNLRILGSDQNIPTIDDVLDCIRGKVPLLIEVKSVSKAGKIEPVLLRKLKQYGDEFAISSFNPLTLAWFKKNAPNIIRGQLSSNLKGVRIGFLKKIILKNLLLNWYSKPAFVGYEISCLPNWIVSLVRLNGTPIIAWTIKTLKEYQKAQNYADNIIFENILP